MNWLRIDMSTTSGWTAVKRDVKLSFDLETTPLIIKTDSRPGSNDALNVRFWTQGGDTAGGFQVSFGSSPTYHISWCTNWPQVPANLHTDNIWRITVTKTPEIRVQIQCNGKEVVNQLVSESACTYNSHESLTHWSRDIAAIDFHTDDTASNFYISYSRK